MTGYEILMSLLMLCFWIGFWLWFFTRNDSSPTPKRRGSPPVLDSRGHFIQVKPDENQNLADWAQ